MGLVRGCAFSLAWQPTGTSDSFRTSLSAGTERGRGALVQRADADSRDIDSLALAGYHRFRSRNSRQYIHTTLHRAVFLSVAATRPFRESALGRETILESTSEVRANVQYRGWYDPFLDDTIVQLPSQA